MKFDLKDKLDLSIVIVGIILISTGAFLRFFKYLFAPQTLERATMLLIPESIIFLLLLTYKLWRR